MKSDDISAPADTGARAKRSAVPVHIVLWLCRIITGGAFTISGWAKSVDPWGFLYKIEDYLTVWHISEPRELILCGAIALSAAEFLIGVCLLCGMLRRAAVWAAAAMMAFMLPLTVYIAVADPVADCGCFGDFIILSNNATLLKNIVISAAVVTMLVLDNRRAGWIFRPAIQWIAISLSGLYILSLAVYGYNVQPLVDFRPYPTGTDLAAAMHAGTDGGDTDGMQFVYSRGGMERSFGIDNLPDSSWTFVRREISAVKSGRNSGFGIYDSEGDDISGELITPQGTLMLVVVADPGIHYLSRSRFVNEVAMTVKADGGDIIGLVGAPWQVVEQWSDLALPDFDVFSADDTELKSLVRGDAALVLVDNGKIVWKRTVGSLDADFTSVHSDLRSYLSLPAPDNGDIFHRLTATYLVLMAVTASFNLLRIRRRKTAGSRPSESVTADE